MHVTVLGDLGNEILATLPRSSLLEGAASPLQLFGPGGSACRQAHAAARFGCNTTLLGVVAVGGFGDYVLRRMISLDEDASDVRAVPVAPTNLTARLTSPTFGVASTRGEGRARMSANSVDPRILRDSGVLFLQQHLPTADAARLARIARQGGCLIVLDATSLNITRACEPIPADWVTTDTKSLQYLCRVWDIFGIDPADKIRLLAARLKAGVACNLGREGALASRKNGEWVAVRGCRSASHSERAASAFSAVFGVILRETANPATALRYATTAADIAELGTNPPHFADRETVERTMLPLSGCSV